MSQYYVGILSVGEGEHAKILCLHTFCWEGGMSKYCVCILSVGEEEMSKYYVCILSVGEGDIVCYFLWGMRTCLNIMSACFL